MLDTDGKEMSEEKIFEEACGLVSDACGLLFETESSEGHAAGFMADNLLKYLQMIKRGDDVLMASADYSAYEQIVYEEFVAHLKEKKNDSGTKQESSTSE
jgi:hypothetical protein